jgi:N-acetylglucosaminyl-diphospho-decaprenol L-rhamnosyltransferase
MISLINLKRGSGTIRAISRRQLKHLSLSMTSGSREKKSTVHGLIPCVWNDLNWQYCRQRDYTGKRGGSGRRQEELWEPPMCLLAENVVLIVGFRNTQDIHDCLLALAAAPETPTFEVFIAENGGMEAMDRLIHHLTEYGLCRAINDETKFGAEPDFMVRNATYMLQGTLGGTVRRVHIAQMADNLGYAGAINVWLRRLLPVNGWHGVWILNPDTMPMPTALAELIAYADQRHVGMVGSRLVSRSDSPWVHSCGLAWRRLAARTLAVGHHLPIEPEPDIDAIEPYIHAPSGASCYITRDVIDQIGLMDERYFLFFEDLEWGNRARRVTRIGYAHRSVVMHRGGTTIGSPGGNTKGSPLGHFLEYRNRILFVRESYPGWLGWTVFMQIAHLLIVFIVEGKESMKIGFRGVLNGLRGRSGRPEEFFRSSTASPRHPC